MTVSTYLLADPDTGEVRYVGKTTWNYVSRFKQHCSSAYKSDVDWPWCGAPTNVPGWIGRLKAEGKLPVPILIATYDCERQVYYSLKERGARLLNHTAPNRRAYGGEQA